jgi:hypothetical protein
MKRRTANLKMKRLTVTLEEQFAKSAKLEKAIRGNLHSVQTEKGTGM